jgi:hypothetical protein
VIDTSFIIAFLINGDAQRDDVAKYVNAFLRAQRDIDLEAHRYTHHYLKELPEEFHSAVDVRAFGPGERIVAEPYTRVAFKRTYEWITRTSILQIDAEPQAAYEDAVVL